MNINKINEQLLNLYNELDLINSKISFLEESKQAIFDAEKVYLEQAIQKGREQQYRNSKTYQKQEDELENLTLSIFSYKEERKDILEKISTLESQINAPRKTSRQTTLLEF